MRAALAVHLPFLLGHTEQGERTRGIVRAEHIHQVIKYITRIVFADALHGFREMLGRAAVQERNDRVPQRVVHHRVQLAALEIGAALGIGYLVGRVLPDLADDQRIRFLLLCRGVQPADKFVRQFVGHIQPPAGGAQPQPVPHDAVRRSENIVLIAFVHLAHLRQGIDPPPRTILIRPLLEIVPAVPGRILRLVRADAVIPARAVEIAAVKARVVEHAVQHHAHAAPRRLSAQLAEILLRAEHRVNGLVIARIIAVVGIRLEDRVKVDRGHAQAFQIVQLLDDPAQRAPEKIVV